MRANLHLKDGFIREWKKVPHLNSLYKPLASFRLRAIAHYLTVSLEPFQLSTLKTVV